MFSGPHVVFNTASFATEATVKRLWLHIDVMVVQSMTRMALDSCMFWSSRKCAKIQLLLPCMLMVAESRTSAAAFQAASVHMWQCLALSYS